MSLGTQHSAGRRRRVGAVAATLASILGVAPAIATDLQLDALDSADHYQRFIVSYREDSAPGVRQDRSVLRRGAAVLPARDAQPLALTPSRWLATGALLVTANRPLDRAEAALLMRQLEADPAVASVEVDQLLQAQSRPNDGAFSQQWAMTAPSGINAVPAWEHATGAGVTVAILDSGITPHPDLDANLLPGYDFISDATAARDGDGRDADPTDQGTWRGSGECGQLSSRRDSSWHGTHVAGIVAAIANNGAGVAGTAYASRIVPVRLVAHCGGHASDLADAIVWAAGGYVQGVPANPQPAHIIHLSLAGLGRCSSTYQKAIDMAAGRGAIVVAAAGNDAIDVASAVPANCDRVIAVGATDEKAARLPSSNFGEAVSISAPGTDIFSTSNSGASAPEQFTYRFETGTSMAAAHVTGVIALMQSVAPTPLSSAAVRHIVRRTARPLRGACPEGCGAGIVDAGSAVAAAIAGDGGQGEAIDPR